LPTVDMANPTNGGFSSTNNEDRTDYTDKSEPIREHNLPFYFLIFSSRYSFKATALLNLCSFVPYSKVIEFCSFAILMIL
jgi:hypothetical protein